MQPTSQPRDPLTHGDAPLETLGLSVRTRNALKSVGCDTIADVLRLDIGRPVRGLGKLAREELLVKLQSAGFAHPSEGPPPGEITRLDRSLERIERRLDAMLGGLSKEVKAARQKLRRLSLRTPSGHFPS